MKFDTPHFRDEDEARRYVEALRWPSGRVCGKCGSLDSYETKKTGRYRCAQKECRKDFKQIACEQEDFGVKAVDSRPEDK